MPSRVAAIFCLVLVAAFAGCRKPIAPALDDLAPETWIVAAPQDTITTRDPNDVPIPPIIGPIPVRFHLYWAGSDRDGIVTGFFWAVVETLPVPPAGGSTVPSLPGPKARDYRFTTATDSIFIFHASEEVNARQHAFYIYAVDDKGRADPTPARFIFSSYDRFPPLAVIDECKATGTEYSLQPDGSVQPIQKTYFVTDFFEVSNDHAFPRDTVSSNALLSMRWHGVPTIPSTVVTGYKYKLDEPNFNAVDSSVHVASYNTGVGTDHVNPGPKIFTLRAIGQSGWRGENTRWFQMNFAPDTWFCGPDPNDPLGGWRTHVDGQGKRYWYLDFGTRSWKDAFTGIPGSMMSRDSAFVLPARRPQRRTFLEAYQQRLWLRQEGDTVHLNSWVILPAGGFDRDSPYAVRINEVLLGDSLKAYPVLTPAGPNGSPCGFRVGVQMKDNAGFVSAASEGTTYPVEDPASFDDQRVINGYTGVITAGKAYAVVRAVDGDGTVDERLTHRPGGAAGVADRVDDNAGSPEDRALRSKVLTFFVDHAPVLQTNARGFHPRPGAGVTLPRHIAGADAFNLPATDDDPFDASQSHGVGGPSSDHPSLRWKIAIAGKLAGAPRDTCFVVPTVFTGAAGISFDIPDWIAAGDITVRVRLCDCAQCDVHPGYDHCPFAGREQVPGEGVCVDTDIPCQLAGPSPKDRP